MINFHNAQIHAKRSAEIRQVISHIRTEGHWDLTRQEKGWAGLGSTYAVMTAKTNIRIPFIGPSNNYAVVTLDETSCSVDRIAIVAEKQVLFDLVLYGTYQPESLIAKLIASIGNYRIDILKRAKKGFETELYSQKLKITVFSQRLFAALLPFERIIHTAANQMDMDTVLRSVKEEIRTLYAQLNREHYGPFLKAMLESNKDEIFRTIEAFRIKAQSVDSEDGKKLLIGLARLITRQGQTLNRTITEDDIHSRAVLRGNLNNYFEDCLNIINKFNYDFGRVFPQHQGLLPDMPLGTTEPSQGLVLSDLMGIRDLDVLALAIDDIRQPEGSRRADLNDALEVSEQRTILPIVSNPKWHGIGRSFGLGARRFGLEAGYIILDTVRIPVEIGKAIKLGLKTPASADTSTHQPNTTTQTAFDAASYYFTTSIIEKAKKPHSPWYTRLGTIVADLGRRAITKPVTENIEGGLVSIREKLAELDNHLNDDTTLSASNLFALSKGSYREDEHTISSHRAIVSSAERIEPAAAPGLQSHSDALEPTLLYPSYALTVHGSNTLLGAAAHGAQAFTDTFVHNIHGKHPIIGAIYSILGASTAGAVWFGFGGPHFAGAMLEMSAAVSSGTTFGGVSTGSTVGQISAAIAEAIVHGHESWLARGLDLFSKNPLTITSGMVSGFAIGYVITEVAHIPFISSYLEHELGSIPEIAQFFAGLKIAAVSFEIFLPPGHRTIMKGKGLPDINKELQANDALLSKILQTWNDFLPFLAEEQKEPLRIRLGVASRFKIYQDRLNACIPDLIEDGTFLKLGDALAYLSSDKKFAILSACKSFEQHHQLHGLLFPPATRSVIGETIFRIARPPVRIAAAAYFATKAVTWDSQNGKVIRTLRFAGNEVVRAIVNDIGKDLVVDALKALFELASTATTGTARVVKSTLVVAPLSLIAKIIKIAELFSRNFEAIPVSEESPIEIGMINLAKMQTGKYIDRERGEAWFFLRSSWHKGTHKLQMVLHEAERFILQKKSHPPTLSPVNSAQEDIVPSSSSAIRITRGLAPRASSLNRAPGQRALQANGTNPAITAAGIDDACFKQSDKLRSSSERLPRDPGTAVLDHARQRYSARTGASGIHSSHLPPPGLPPHRATLVPPSSFAAPVPLSSHRTGRRGVETGAIGVPPPRGIVLSSQRNVPRHNTAAPTLPGEMVELPDLSPRARKT